MDQRQFRVLVVLGVLAVVMGIFILAGDPGRVTASGRSGWLVGPLCLGAGIIVTVGAVIRRRR